MNNIRTGDLVRVTDREGGWVIVEVLEPLEPQISTLPDMLSSFRLAVVTGSRAWAGREGLKLELAAGADAGGRRILAVERRRVVALRARLAKWYRRFPRGSFVAFPDGDAGIMGRITTAPGRLDRYEVTVHVLLRDGVSAYQPCFRSCAVSRLRKAPKELEARLRVLDVTMRLNGYAAKTRGEGYDP